MCTHLPPCCQHVVMLEASMRDDYGIVPSVVHYTCMVDLLGRAEKLEEAKPYLGSLTCRSYSNVELGESAAKELLNLEPTDASVYELLSNIYATAGKWEDLALVRNLMQERGIHKAAGCS